MKKFLTLAAVVLCLAACKNNGTAEVKYSSSDVTAYAGGVFYVEMTGIPGTGFSWNITNADKLQYVKLKSVEDITAKKDTNIVGAPSVLRFEFAVLPGTSGKTETVKFAYFRTWETGVPPAEEKVYTVSIK